MGDWIHGLGLTYHIGIAMVIFGLIGVITHIIHLWYYKNGLKPLYLKPFHMMSGLITPESIGLTHREDVISLLKRTKIWFNFCKYLLISSIFVALIISIIAFARNATLIQFIFLAIPWIIVLIVYIVFTDNFFLYQIAYFDIICFYLNLKLKRLNEMLLIDRRSAIKKSIKLLKSFYAIHSEIHKFNDNYWSTYLFWTLIGIMFDMNLIIFIALFSNIIIIHKIDI